MRTFALIFFGVFVVGCGSSDPCAQAEARFAECSVESPSGFGEACARNPGKADELMTMSCEDVSAAASSAKADGAWSLADLAEGRRCVFNAQCAGELVCRSIEGSKRCAVKGDRGAVCDSHDDCRSARCATGQESQFFVDWNAATLCQ